MATDPVRRPLRARFLWLFLGLFMACAEPPTPMDLAQVALIPQPVSLTATGSSFRLADDTHLYAASADATAAAEFLAACLRPATGLALPVMTGEPGAGSIAFRLQDDPELGSEGYELTITETGITLSAPAPAGLFYGVQTLRQLLPAQIETGSRQAGPWEIASGTIRDMPRFGYRGAMLDVARHFFSVEDVKRYIDLLAAYKLNVLHLHLTDDQGWRIEIKSWPKLTEVGGSTEVGGGEGGFYTQEQYADIVAYAAARHMLIVPEIDMPGHTNAALVSYPELNCDGRELELYTGTEVGFSTFCTQKEIVYEFIDDVIGELAALTPGPYIHIGGDESHVTKMEDYIPFVERVQAIVKKHGKEVIGWDEIAHAQLVPGSTVQYWAKAENAAKGLAQGAKVLISPAAFAYIDMKYDSTTELGLSWAAYIEVDRGYNWEPVEQVEGITEASILGIEAPLWAETIDEMADIEYLAFPRIPGYAEIGWSPAGQKDWAGYRQRLAAHGPRFEALGINYYRSPLVDWPAVAAAP